MDYCEFCDAVLADARDRLQADSKVELTKVLKNNGIELVGINVMDKGKLIGPTIYLEDYYEQYRYGKNLEEIMENFLEVYQKNKTVDLGVSPDFFWDFSKVKNRLIFKLINYERNRELLKDIPHKKVLDLALIFCCAVSLNNGRGSVITVKNSHLAMWKVDCDTVYEMALNNTPILLQKRIESIEDIIKDGRQYDRNMLVLTNHQSMYGAGVVLYEGVLEEIAINYNASLYILPSSIHEVIVMKATDYDDVEALKDMVRSVNQFGVDAKEILSDNVYVYNKESQKIFLA